MSIANTHLAMRPFYPEHFLAALAPIPTRTHIEQPTGNEFIFQIYEFEIEMINEQGFFYKLLGIL